MKILLLILIKFYWFIIPADKRRKCIFKKSCSHYVFDITKKQGIIKGMKSLLHRFKHCRSGYYVIHGKNGRLLISAHNMVFDENEIDENILNSN